MTILLIYIVVAMIAIVLVALLNERIRQKRPSDMFDMPMVACVVALWPLAALSLAFWFVFFVLESLGTWLGKLRR